MEALEQKDLVITVRALEMAFNRGLTAVILKDRIFGWPPQEVSDSPPDRRLLALMMAHCFEVEAAGYPDIMLDEGIYTAPLNKPSLVSCIVLILLSEMSANGKGPPDPSISLFPDGNRLSYQDSTFTTAGRDVYITYAGPHGAKSTLNSMSSDPLIVAAHSLASSNEDEVPPTVTAIALAQKRRRNSGSPHPTIKKHKAADQNSTPAIAPRQVDHETTCQCSTHISSAVYARDGIGVSSADASTVSLQSPEPTKAETYILEMHKSGKGLAAWDPRPRKPYADGHGVIPGDVGTFSAEGGFKKTFNIFDDETSIRAYSDPQVYNLSWEAYTPPKLEVATHEGKLPLGHTIAEGTSVDIKLTSRGGAVASGAFRCHSTKGAILVLTTSSADLEELEDHIPLRDFIIDNAALLYLYANSIRRLDDHESLYIITGCIKSDGWALAAFKDLADPPDVIRLVKKGGSCDSLAPTYQWPSRGTAEVLSGSNVTLGTDHYRGKNQSLFLRGYKMAFSQPFRLRMNGQFPGPGGPGRGDTSSSPDSSTGGESSHKENHDGRPFSGGDRGGSHGFSFANESNSRFGNVCSDEIMVQPFPVKPRVPFLHPCDEINEERLAKTQADCALSHDDEWRFWFQDGTDTEALTRKEPQWISCRNGVAFLAAASRDSPDVGAGTSVLDVVVETIRNTIPFDQCTDADGFGIGQNAPSIGGALPALAPGSPPQVLTVRFVQLNPSVLNCTITGHNAVPFMEVATGPTPGGILRTILRRSNEGGFAYIDWGRYAFVEINNCVERKPINEWLPLSADRSRRIMNVQGRNFMWYNRDNSTYLDLDGAPSNPPNPPLARIFRIGEDITLALSTEAFQYNLQYAAIVATVLFHSGHFNDGFCNVVHIPLPSPSSPLHPLPYTTPINVPHPIPTPHNNK